MSFAVAMSVFSYSHRHPGSIGMRESTDNAERGSNAILDRIIYRR